MRKAIIVMLAAGLMGFAGSASAFDFVGADITSDTVWIPNAPPIPGFNSCPIVLENPIFVKDGATLTIGAGCVVRGQPRSQPVMAGQVAGSPGALIVTQTGRVEMNGTATNPVIFTTAAVDTDNDGVADTVGPPTGDNFVQFTDSGEQLLDANPAAQPLAPLNGDGDSNVSLWGGLVILGNAPTNLGTDCLGTDQYGQCTIEGLTIPGFSPLDATYGGSDPHDSSGVLRFVSVRHAGDEIGEGNELNCISFGGVGDGTVLENIECYANFDDGFEFFGGTAGGRNWMATFIGDDSFDVDQGYTGVSQFLLAVMPTFNENDGEDYGSGSGDKGCECDGDDAGNVSLRFDPLAAGGVIDDVCWPLSNPAFYNMTIIGSTPDAANPATSPAAANRGLQMRNGFAGKVFNSIVVNTGAAAGLDIVTAAENDSGVLEGGCAGSQVDDNTAAGLIAVVSSSFEDVAPIPGYDAGGASIEADALLNGDALAPLLGAANTLFENSVNDAGPGGARAFGGLVNEFSAIEPQGANGTPRVLDAADLPAPIDPDPVASDYDAGGVPPRGPGLDSGATYRGAFEPNAPNWTTGWTTLNAAGLLAD